MTAYRGARKSVAAWLEPERWYGWISGSLWGG
jgi:hypothetical protein